MQKGIGMAMMLGGALKGYNYGVETQRKRETEAKEAAFTDGQRARILATQDAEDATAFSQLQEVSKDIDFDAFGAMIPGAINQPGVDPAAAPQEPIQTLPTGTQPTMPVTPTGMSKRGMATGIGVGTRHATKAAQTSAMAAMGRAQSTDAQEEVNHEVSAGLASGALAELRAKNAAAKELLKVVPVGADGQPDFSMLPRAQRAKLSAQARALVTDIHNSSQAFDSYIAVARKGYNATMATAGLQALSTRGPAGVADFMAANGAPKEVTESMRACALKDGKIYTPTGRVVDVPQWAVENGLAPNISADKKWTFLAQATQSANTISARDTKQALEGQIRLQIAEIAARSRITAAGIGAKSRKDTAEITHPTTVAYNEALQLSREIALLEIPNEKGVVPGVKAEKYAELDAKMRRLKDMLPANVAISQQEAIAARGAQARETRATPPAVDPNKARKPAGMAHRPVAPAAPSAAPGGHQKVRVAGRPGE